MRSETAVLAEAGFKIQVELSQEHLIGIEKAVWFHSVMWPSEQM